MIIWTYRILIKVKLSDSLQGEPFRLSYIFGQLTGSGLIQARKGPNSCFKRFPWIVHYLTSIKLCQIFLHPNDSSDFQYQCKKKCKNEDFWISSLISTAVNFKVLWCLLVCYNVFSWHSMKSDSNHVFSIVQKIIIKCVMTNKMVWNERMSPFKHVHII